MNARVLFGVTAASIAAACASSHSGGAATDSGAADGGPPLIDVLDLPPRCTSGATRDPNESEGPEMMPGHACIACHDATIASTGEDAPLFAFGGTAFPSGHEPDDCIGSGAEGAHVTVSDATGAMFTAEANHSGNFLVEDQVILFPITAVIEISGRRREMTSPQMSGDCNSCHTQEGANGAPGRITLP